MHFVTSSTFVTGSQPRLHIKALPAIKIKAPPYLRPIKPESSRTSIFLKAPQQLKWTAQR